MDILVDVFKQGGIFSYLVLVAGMIGLAVDFLQMVLIKRLNLMPLIAGSVIGTVLVGIIGTGVGAVQAFSAVAFAAPDQRLALLTKGFSIALLTTWLGILVAGIQCFFGALTATIHVNIKPKGSSR
jgi:hypothetical protein